MFAESRIRHGLRIAYPLLARTVLSLQSVTPWYQQNPARLSTEVSLLRSASNAVLAWQGTTLIADEETRIGQNAFGLRMVFPDDFPNVPPIVRLLYPDLPVTVELHRFQGGALCLLGDGEWSPRMTALAIRNRAVLWLHSVFAYLETGVFPQPTPARPR